MRATNSVSVTVCRNGSHITNDSVDLFISNIRIIIDVLSRQSRIGFRVEGRSGGNGRNEHTHRVSIISEALHNLVDILMNKGMGLDFVLPELELGGSREFSIDQEESNFQEV